MAGIDRRHRYDPSAILGSPSPVNIVVGARRYGKTYSLVRHGIRRYIRKGETFVYLRRSDNELKDTLGGSKTGFFNPFVTNNEFPGYELRINGRIMEIKPDGEKKWQTMGSLMALSLAQNYKGRNEAGETGTIIFDEFIKEKGRTQYLPNEPEQLLGLWSTLDGYRDRTRVYMLANAADLVNPYFMEWHLTLPAPGEMVTTPHGNSSITIQNAFGADFAEEVKHTNIGRFMAGSDYERYALNNEFRQQTGVFVAEKPSDARYRYSIMFAGTEYGIWQSRSGDLYIAPPAHDADRPIYVLLRDDMRPNLVQIERVSPLLRIIRNAWAGGYLWFVTDQDRERFTQCLRLIGVR